MPDEFDDLISSYTSRDDDVAVRNDDELDDTDEGVEEALRAWREMEDGSDTAKEIAAQEDEAFKRDYEEALRLTGELSPEPPPLSPIEEMAKKAATDEGLAWLKEAVSRDIERQQAAFRSGQPGFDEAGEPVVEAEPLDIEILTTAQMDSLIKAISSGYTEQDWRRQQRMNG